jgi:hypothetical protein
MSLSQSATVTNIGGNTVFCAIGGSSTAGNPQVIDSASYMITTGSGTFTGGTLSFQMLGVDGNWRTMTTPGSLTAAAMTITLAASSIYNGQLAVTPCKGLRFITQSMAGGSVSYAELIATWR